MKIEDPIKKISGNNGNLGKNGFLGTTGTWKKWISGNMGSEKEWGMIRKKFMPLPNVQTHQ